MRGIIIAILAVATLLAALLFGLSLLSFVAEKSAWGEYAYKIRNEREYYYTNGYELDGNCVVFIDNYGNNQRYCEKFVIGENYLHNNGLTLKALIWGY